MFRSIQIATAIMLSCIMLVVSATSHLGLSYCLCQNTVFLGDCVCETETPENASAKAATSCCSSKSCSVQDVDHHDVQHSEATSIATLQATPCTDCYIKINWELDYCISFNHTEFQSSTELEVDNKLTHRDRKTIPAHTNLRVITTRGSPHETAFLHDTSVPLYKRHSVFLI